MLIHSLFRDPLNNNNFLQVFFHNANQINNIPTNNKHTFIMSIEIKYFNWKQKQNNNNIFPYRFQLIPCYNFHINNFVTNCMHLAYPRIQVPSRISPSKLEKLLLFFSSRFFFFFFHPPSHFLSSIFLKLYKTFGLSSVWWCSRVLQVYPVFYVYAVFMLYARPTQSLSLFLWPLGDLTTVVTATSSVIKRLIVIELKGKINFTEIYFSI